MLSLTGDESMLAQTAKRVGDPTMFARPILVTGTAQAEAVEAELGAAIGALILEPSARNTAPAIALAALNVTPEELLLVLPSDHLIKNEDAFVAAVRKAAPHAREGWIVTFGMKAERPETGYGYIRRGEPLGDGVFRAERFVEKPDIETARAYCADGGYDWNGGIFLFSAGAFLEALARHAPAIFEASKEAVSAQRHEGRRIRPDATAFAAAPSMSVDYAVMEKADRVAVVPVSLDWSDVGSWDALLDALDKDDAGNAVAGDMIALDNEGCLIRSEGPLVAAIGVKDLVVVATADAVLVVPRDQCQRVKEVVERLKAEGRNALL